MENNKCIWGKIVVGGEIADAQASGTNVGGGFEEWLWPMWLGGIEPGWE